MSDRVSKGFSRLLQVTRWLGQTRFGWWAVGLSLALCLPSLGVGLQTEDYFHSAAVQNGTVSIPQQVNLFAYSNGSISEIYARKDAGLMPWLTVEDYRLSFWRPLSSLTHYIDYRFWPTQTALMHAHSLAWFGVLIAAVSRFYRRLSPSLGVAALASILYAVDDAHGPAVGWLANRNALIACLFGVLSVLFHDLWRQGRGRWGAWLSPLTLGLALLGGELALGAIGYFIAYSIFLDRAPLKRRIVALMPGLAVVTAWVIGYRALGHGASSVGLYVDPFIEPGAFLKDAVWKIPALVLGTLGYPTTDWWNQWSIDRRYWLSLGVWGSLAGVTLLLWPLFKRDRLVRFWGLGLLLSVVPLLATFPQDRLLWFPGIGAMGMIASLWATLIESRAQAPSSAQSFGTFRRTAVGGLALAWFLLHAVLGPVSLPKRTLVMKEFGQMVEKMTQSAQRVVSDPEQHVILLNAPSFYMGTLSLSIPNSQRMPLTRHGRILYGGLEALSVTRIDSKTLLLSAPNGFLTDPLDRVFRGFRHPVKAGDGLQLSSMLIIVEKITAQGTPMKVRVSFSKPLEDRMFKFISWENDGYRSFSLPAVGETTILPPIHL